VISKTEISVETIQLIRDRDPAMLKTIYKEIYPMVEKYVRENSGSRDDAKDIFQDSMFLLIKKVESTEFQLSSKLSTFLFGISKNLWLKKITVKKLDTKAYFAEKSFLDVPEDDDQKIIRLTAIKRGIDELGEPCSSIIKAFYYFKQSMQEIAEEFRYANPKTAKNQKYKCLMRLKKFIIKGS
jgi:RNA polymerase sigma factor (sigma-70 family)